MPKKAKPHERLAIDSKIVLATGLGGVGRKYPDYYAKFGEENVTVLCWNKNCTDLESHIQKIKENIPKDTPFVACGHSMGGSIWLELLSREKVPNLKGIVLVGASRKLRSEQGVEFIMKFLWPFLWFFVTLVTIALPITIFIWRHKTFEENQGNLWDQ
ncbi:MAG: alpha/beta hydrolase [Candidatus Heimdallarchaeota archaeon]